MHWRKKIVFALILLSIIPFSCLLNNIKRTEEIGWKEIIPAYITDSFYVDTANGFNKQKIEFGRYLFYDRRLSFNNTKSCVSCHDPDYSFTDSYRRSTGASGGLHQRNSRPLINIIFNKYLTAADSTIHFPEQQIVNPMFHTSPVELGWKGNETIILERIKNDTFYKRKFTKEIEGNETALIKNIQNCIAQFVKSIISFDSPYDRYRFKQLDVLSPSAKRGIQLFFSDSLACSSCHGGDNFSTPAIKSPDNAILYYFNTGLYNLDGKGKYPEYDQGLTEHTHNTADMGKFRVPTLRNLAFTSPYYHDGSAASLEEVVSNYENGGRLITRGIYKGDGKSNSYKNKLIKGFSLTSQERKDLVNFLLSLSDSSLINNKAYTNPFLYDETRY